MFRTLAGVLAASASIATSALAQSEPGADAQSGSASANEARWIGLPFSSLSDYESKIPVGMSRDELVQRLGQPEQTMPGQRQDQVYFYSYALQDDRELTAVVVLRDNAVFIRRLYVSTRAANGSAAH